MDGFRAPGVSGFRGFGCLRGLGFRVWGSGFRGFRISARTPCT